MDRKTSTITRTASKRQSLPVEQMDRDYVIIPLCDLYVINRSTVVLRLDHEILICKTIIVVMDDVL